MTTAHRAEVLEIQQWADVPAFANEDEERAFRDTHALGEALLTEALTHGEDGLDLPPPRGRAARRAHLISLRLDPDVRDRLKAIAQRHSTGYQTLLKQWIAERLAIEEGKP